MKDLSTRSVPKMIVGGGTDDGVNTLQVTGGAAYYGNVLRGVASVASSGLTATVQNWGSTGANSTEVTGSYGASAVGAVKSFAKTRGASPGSYSAVLAGDMLGSLQWYADDGADYTNIAAFVRAYAEADATSNNVQAYLSFYTNPGAQNPSEAVRFTGSGTQLFRQAGPAAKTTAVTLTMGELMAGLITGTPTAGNTAYTLPLGTDAEAGILGLAYAGQSFDWTLINLATGSNTITLTANTGHTIVGNALVAISTSSTWRTRRAGANTFVTYRIA